MKKFVFCLLIISALFVYSAQAQSTSEPILYLEINETNLPENSTVGLSIRLPVTSEAEAITLRDELVQRFFQGVTYTAQLHIHRTDGPCEVTPL